MSGTVTGTNSGEVLADRTAPERELPNASMLVDQLPASVKLSRMAAGFTVTLALLYLLFSFKPIWHTDIWGHLSYGKVLWNLGSLPTEEPLLPLATGMPFVDTAWLSQLASYGVETWLGLAGLQGLTALCATAACGFVLLAGYRATRNAISALAALGLFIWINWYQLIVLRPELFGLVCFTWLLARLTGRPRSSDWISIPAVMLLWTNLHGSFVVGVGLMGALTFGRVIDLVRRTGNIRAIVRDHRLQRLALLTELAFAATLINPYGPWIYREVLSFGSNLNLQSIVEWQPLASRSWVGMSLLTACALIAVLYRITPRRVKAWEPLALVGLTTAACWTARMSAWWTPVAAYLFAVHVAAIWRHWRPAASAAQPSPRGGIWTVTAIGVVWICFGYSPLGLRLLHGKSPTVERAVIDYTPVGAAYYLREYPPQGQVFNIYEWGDYLQWAGPPGLKVFVNSHAHSVPREVWYNYLLVTQLGSGWQEALDRYSVNTIVLDRALRENLIKALKDDNRWRVGYEDHIATIFIRKDAPQSHQPASAH